MSLSTNDESLQIIDSFVEKFLIFIVLLGVVAILFQGIFGLVFGNWHINDLWEGLKFLPESWIWVFNSVFIISGWIKVVFWVLTKLDRL